MMVEVWSTSFCLVPAPDGQNAPSVITSTSYLVWVFDGDNSDRI
jgi:hypothetical protein